MVEKVSVAGWASCELKIGFWGLHTVCVGLRLLMLGKLSSSTCLVFVEVG